MAMATYSTMNAPTSSVTRYVPTTSPGYSQYPATSGVVDSTTRDIYQPMNTTYVRPGQALRGGMSPLYDQHAVPTFEAPLILNVVADSSSAIVGEVARAINEPSTLYNPAVVQQRDADYTSSSSTSAHKQVSKTVNKADAHKKTKFGCCGC